MHKPNQTLFIPLILNFKNICKATKFTKISYNSDNRSEIIAHSNQIKVLHKASLLCYFLARKGRCSIKRFYLI
jgi:hypothetical protein